ncbi:MAG: peptidoglycan bridge formation glycyltransferase FemA/FemB family protein [bacterium]|nr:peptidoglycan bridge formation glycyltransferase FemA/FemB family protein [bacterium]
MYIKTLSIKEFQEYTQNSKYNNFHQSINYAFLKSEEGYEYELIGYVDNEKIYAAALVLVQLLNGYLYAYVPEGFLIDYNNYELLENFTNDLYNWYKKDGITFIRINPRIPIAKVDLNTLNPIYNNNFKLIESLKKCGYIKIDDTLYFDSILPRFDAIINLNDFNIMKVNKNTRNKIKKSIRKGLNFEKSNSQSMNILYKFIKNKIHKDMFHYSDYYNIFSKDNAVDYFLVSIDNEKLILNTQKAYEKELEKNELLNQKILKLPSNKNINKKMNSDKALLSYKNDIAIANKYILKNEKTYIAGALVIKYGNTITILISGYDKKFKDYSPNYYLYYNILMNYKNEYKYACLNGVSGDFSKENKYYGLNKFKMGFNPDIYEYIGEFDLVLNKINYYFLNKKNLINKEFKKDK